MRPLGCWPESHPHSVPPEPIVTRRISIGAAALALVLVACSDAAGPASTPVAQPGRYVITSVDGSAAPFLLADETDGRGTRLLETLVADTIELLPKHKARKARLTEQHYFSADGHEVGFGSQIGVEDTGEYLQDEENLVVTWRGLVSPYTDTLVVLEGELEHRVDVTRVCAACVGSRSITLRYALQPDG